MSNKKIGLFRADIGFCSSSILDYIESKKIPYVMSCTLYSNITSWNAIGEGIFISEIKYKQNGWKKERRIIVIKQDEEVRPKATGKKLRTLFSGTEYDNEKFYRTRYHAFVTDQDLPAKRIWEQYKGRGESENRIKELKEDFV